MAEKSFNPYGSAISRTGLFVYDPTKAVEKSLAKGEEAFKQPLEKLSAQRAQDIQYAQDIFNNLGELLDQGELEHNARINEEVNRLVEETKSNMVVRGKGGGIKSFNFNNPEFQAQLQTGIKRVKNGINNSKLLKAQYNDFVTFLNTNEDIVSNQVGLINEAAAKLLDSKNIFTSNNVVNDFTNLKNRSIDDVKYSQKLGTEFIEGGTKVQLTYQKKDQSGNLISVTGNFNKDLYQTTGSSIDIDKNGDPIVNQNYIQNIKEQINANDFVPKSTKDWIQNNPQQFENFLTSNLIMKYQTKEEKLKNLVLEEKIKSSQASRKEGDDEGVILFPTIKRSSLDNKPYTGVDVGKVKIENIPVDKIGDVEVQLPIPEIIDIGYTLDGEQSISARFGERVVVLTKDIKVSDVYDEETLQGMDEEVLNAKFDQNTIDNIWGKTLTKIQQSLSERNKNTILESLLNLRSKPTKKISMSEGLTKANSEHLFSSVVTEKNLPEKEEILNLIQNREDKTSGLTLKGEYYNLEKVINIEENLSNQIKEFNDSKKDALDKETKGNKKINKIINDISSDVEELKKRKETINKGKTGFFGADTPYAQGQANIDFRRLLDNFFEKIDKKISEAESLGATDDQIKKLQDLKEQINK